LAKIKTNNLNFSYNIEEEVLKGIYLEFDERSTAIIGQNGSGKTTFVKLLKDLLTPSSGDIIINSVNTKTTTAARLAKHIGLVFQNPNDQIFKSKVLEEVMFGPLNIGFTKDLAKAKAETALQQVGIYDKAAYNPYDLSLSEHKLISITSILAMNTEIIIFDEPTITQDHKGRENIKNIIRRLRENRKLVITIIHDMDFVAETFGRTIVFNNGKVLLDGETREVFSHAEELCKAYLEPPHVTQLCRKLGYKETFLTVQEFLDFKSNNQNCKGAS
jgi:energy-coupling factor transport system ATP-binding protein